MYLSQGISAFLIRTVDLVQGRGVWPTYRRLEESQWWAPDRLRELQVRKLRDRLREVEEGSRLLGRRLAEAGVEAAQVDDLEVLRRLPVLQREDLQDRGEELRNHRLSPAESLPNSTGGSTGRNISFLVDRECWRARDAADLRLWSFLGLGPGARVATLWGSPMDMTAAGRWKETIRRVVDNRRFFSAYRIGHGEMDGILDWLARARPEVLMGYASVLDLAARRAMERGGLDGPRHVISSAEALFPDQRERMEKAWGARVSNLYGCREVGLVAMECEARRGLHVMDERMVLERSEGQGHGPADILVTDLDNRATPFLRYRVGDLATPAEAGDCPCGRGLSRVGEVVGRSFDVIRGSSGQAVGGTFWSLLLRTGVQGIETFQVVQHEPDRLEIRVTPAGGLDDAARAVVRDRVREALGEAMRVEFTECRQFEPLPSGKHRFVISKVEEQR